MNEGRTVFAQLMDELPQYEFAKCVRRYRGNHRVRSLPTHEQFLVMAFAQLTYRESWRDITTCLGAVGSKLYHSGLRQTVARSTLADANEKRDRRIFADFAQGLIKHASALYADEPFGVELQQAAYALDSTTIDLCLSLFPWAKFRRHKAAIKLHTLLTLRGNFPTVIILTPGKVHDGNILDDLSYEAARFTSWIAAIWTLRACAGCTSLRPSSSRGPNTTSVSSAAPRAPWTRPPAGASPRASS